MAEKKKSLAEPNPDKEKALKTALEQLEKTYGKGTVMRLGENVGMNVEHISTGSITLDVALGIGGLPKGRIVEMCSTFIPTFSPRRITVPLP